MPSLRWIVLAVGLVAVAAVAVSEFAGGISEEAAALIAAGDAVQDQAEQARRDREALEQELAALTGADNISRSLTPKPDDAEVEALKTRIATAERTETQLRSRAVDLWQRAASIDAEAQDAILQRLRGTRPKS